MKLNDVKPSMYIKFIKENNKECPKFKVVDVRIWKYKTTFGNAMFQIGLKKFLWLKKLKNTAPWTDIVINLNGEEIIEAFFRKNLLKTSQKEICVEIVIK